MEMGGVQGLLRGSQYRSPGVAQVGTTGCGTSQYLTSGFCRARGQCENSQVATSNGRKEMQVNKEMGKE